MAIELTTDFKPFCGNPWFQTIVPNYIFKSNLKYERQRIFLSDSDFIDLDFLKSSKNSAPLVVLVHGFEGDSKSTYIIKTARFLNKLQINVVVMNLRGCSGEDNLKPYSYHSGKTQDLHEVLEYCKKSFSEIYLMGFSLGANLILKYLANFKDKTPVIKALVVSAPFELEKSARKIIRNKLVDNRFLKSLKRKIIIKKQKFPVEMNHIDVNKLTNIIDVDEDYTAYFHGFNSASDFYSYASSINYISEIQTPTLIINALDDPLLVHPEDKIHLFKDLNLVTLLLTKRGGHVGFLTSKLNLYYLDKMQNYFNFV